MIKFVLTFSVFIVATTASSEFTILSNPKSIEFRGNEVLGSQYIGDVLNAAIGNTITTDANWDGLFIKDPFDLSRGTVAILVEGIDHVSFGSAAKTYELEGNRGAESINSLAVELQAENLNVCNINFNDFDNGLASYRKCFADVGEPQIDQTVNLKPDEYVGDRHFLQAIAYLKAAAKNFSNGRRTTHFLAIHIPMKKIVSVHGKSSEAMSEALNILVTATDYINGAAQRAHNNNALVVAIVSENSMVQRAKRQALAGNKDSNPYNLAEFYTQDYPVIFNIILWFMVVFGLALLAICYAIASMDPGRDSIIYRMTSTRMKKDN